MYKRSIDFAPSITLTTAWIWNATVTYPGTELEYRYEGWDIHELRNHIFQAHPALIEKKNGLYVAVDNSQAIDVNSRE